MRLFHPLAGTSAGTYRISDGRGGAVPASSALTSTAGRITRALDKRAGCCGDQAEVRPEALWPT